MKIVIFFALALIAGSYARPQVPQTRKYTQNTSDPRASTIVQYENSNIGTGPYSFVYETSDGQSRQETAVIKNPGTDDEYIEVQGQYSYIDQSGNKITVTYKADKNGFQPTGTHIPSRK